MQQLNSHNFEEIYNKLGINLDELGCVMLDLKSPKNTPVIAPSDLYYSKNKSRKWINGMVSGETPHITLLYGLLKNAHTWEVHVERVLRDWKLKTVEIDYVDFFESQYDDEAYYCIVAHIKVDEKLLEGHERLEFLPHINTFTGYKPHMTICYIKKDEALRDRTIKQMNDALMGKTLAVKSKINLGYEH